jgi:hypothetical protein
VQLSGTTVIRTWTDGSLARRLLRAAAMLDRHLAMRCSSLAAGTTTTIRRINGHSAAAA